MKTKKPREVRHRIRCTDLGLISTGDGSSWSGSFYRERFETKCRGKKIVFDSDVPKMTVVTQEHRDVEAHATLALLRRHLVNVLTEYTVSGAWVVLNGNRKGLYWIQRR